MPDNILEKIIKKKIERIDLLKKSISLKSLDEKINQNRLFINFKDKIQKNIDTSTYIRASRRSAALCKSHAGLNVRRSNVLSPSTLRFLRHPCVACTMFP